MKPGMSRERDVCGYSVHVASNVCTYRSPAICANLDDAQVIHIADLLLVSRSQVHKLGSASALSDKRCPPSLCTACTAVLRNCALWPCVTYAYSTRYGQSLPTCEKRSFKYTPNANAPHTADLGTAFSGPHLDTPLM